MTGKIYKYKNINRNGLQGDTFTSNIYYVSTLFISGNLFYKSLKSTS